MQWSRRVGIVAFSLAGLVGCTGAAGQATPASGPGVKGPPAPATAAVSAPVASRKLPVDTPRDEVVDVVHGVRVADPYRWLEDGSTERVRAWTASQNAHSRAFLDAIPAREQTRSSIERLLSVGTIEQPSARKTKAGTWRYFYTKRTGMQNQPVLLMRDGLAAPDQVVLDVNALAADGTVALDWFYPSRDGRLLAYGTSRNGDENSTLRIRDLGRKDPVDLPDAIENTRHCSLTWKPDGSGFFYTRFPKKGDVPAGEEKYHRSVFEHRLGADPASDTKVFGDGREMTDSPGVELSPNGRWLTLGVHQGWAKSELYLIDLKDPRRALVPVAVGVEAEYFATPLDDRIIVQTTEKASRGRIVSIDPRNPAKENWKEIIPESSDTLDTIVVTSSNVVATYLHDAASRVKRFSLQGQPIGEIALPTLGTAAVSGETNGRDVFIGFKSFAVPGDVYRAPLEGKEAGVAQLWQRIESPLAPDAYAVEQLRAQSKDGTSVPYFVVRRRDVTLDGTGAALLTGYGGFNIAMEPRFVGAAGALLERGGIYVIANLRGGSEYGETWHQAGMLSRKQNVFDDMIAVAHDVVDRKIAARDRLGITGASNGGLLASVMIVQQPGLFRVAVPRVPLTDMLRYQNFLLAKFWVPEYGSADDAQLAPVLLAYSPYHNVREGVRYPAVLLTAGESDGRVDPMHARKMAAALQHATSSDEPVLLRVEVKAGHGAGKPISKQLEEFTDVYSFVMSELGLIPGASGAAAGQGTSHE